MKLLPLLSLVILSFHLSNVTAQEAISFTECPEASKADSYALWSVILIEDCSPVQSHVDHSSVFLANPGLAQDGQMKDAKVALLQSVLTLTQKLFSQNPGVAEASKNAFANALRCDVYRIEQAFFTNCADTTKPGNALQVRKWQATDNRGTVYRLAFLDPVEAKAPECLAAKPDVNSDCHRIMLEEYGPILELHNLMRQVIVPGINEGIKEAVAVRYSENQLRWASYLSQTGFQYPLELVFNRRRHGGFSEIAQDLPAPTWRWIALHPTAGIYHSDKLPDGNQTALLGIVKIIGGKQWTYGSDNKPDRIIGLSLTATIADIAGIDDLGFGALAEYKNIALGVSRHGDENLVVFNVALDELLRSRSRTLEQWLPKLGF